MNLQPHIKQANPTTSVQRASAITEMNTVANGPPRGMGPMMTPMMTPMVAPMYGVQIPAYAHQQAYAQQQAYYGNPPIGSYQPAPYANMPLPQQQMLPQQVPQQVQPSNQGPIHPQTSQPAANLLGTSLGNSKSSYEQQEVKEDVSFQIQSVNVKETKKAPALSTPDPTARSDWGLDGVDFNVPTQTVVEQKLPTQPSSLVQTQRQMNNEQQSAPSTGMNGTENEVNDWPAPDDVDPAVWAQLPAHMQRELLLQQADKERIAVPPSNLEPRGADAYRAMPPSNFESGGADSYRATALPQQSQQHVLDDDPETTVVINVLARISARTLRNKQWKQSIAVIKNRRELLVFRSHSDWQQYQAAGGGSGKMSAAGDMLNNLGSIQELLKKHIVLQPKVHCTPIKAKDYKSYGNLHHFTIEEGMGGSVVAKFASTNASDIFKLRNMINVGVKLASGVNEQLDDENAYGRYEG